MSQSRDGIFEIAIDGLGSTGDGVGRLPDGRVVFVPRALPGDRVRVRLEPGRKKVQAAELLALLTPSPQREASLCDAERCGGCSIKSLSLAGHADLKRQRLVETLRRVGGIEVSERTGPLVQIGDGWHYRHRVRLHVARNGRRWILGFHERKSHRLVPLATCPVLWPELEEAAVALGERVAELDTDLGLHQIEVSYSRVDGRAAARIHLDGPFDALRPWLEAVTRETPVRGVELLSRTGRWREGNLTLRYDHRRASEWDLLYEPGLFTQANPGVNDRLVDAVLAALRAQSGPRILELHAGVGNFTLPLARVGAKLVSSEVHERSVLMARRSARQAGLTIDSRTLSDVEAWDAVGEAEPVDAVLLDPPRIGAREVCERLGASGPARIVYVSCDPATLARDASVLVAGGYVLASLQPYDMFPRTAHVEALAVFDRVPS